MPRNKGFKFRITCRVIESGAKKERCIEFLYTGFEEARRNYKSILLDLYKGRGPVSYRICLNRVKDDRWTNAIFEDRGEK